jgi:hypothetical protein
LIQDRTTRNCRLNFGPDPQLPPQILRDISTFLELEFTCSRRAVIPNIYTLYLQISSTKGALLMEIARVGRSSQERWGDLARGVGR